MAPNLEISIPTTSTSTSAKPYTVYNITLRQPLRSFILSKRYSDFVEFHATLLSQCANISPPAPLPPKTWFKSTVSSPELAESRRRILETYLRTINTTSDTRWRNTAAWRSFLNLPSTTNGNPSTTVTSSAIRSGDLQGPITDSSVWLDNHRDLKTQLRDAKQHLTRRDQASTAQAQHEATSEARRCLVQAGSITSALERGLQIMSEPSEPTKKGAKGRPPKLGEGEVRRRRDLLSAAKKERDALDTTLATFVPKNASATGSEAAAATAGDLANLFKAPNGGSAGGSSSRGRVFGAPLKETERTRELDNDGVVQLQRQIMAEQDEDVTDLTAVVRRMKEMGLQINEELVSQNELLGMLDKDVDRVGDKIDVAKKRLKKIH